MTWFKVDDSFYDHPKVYDAPDASVALWIRAGTWSARNLTNGFVPSGMLARFCGDPDTACRDLVRRGLWERASGGYQFHDWGDYQPTRESIEEGRRKNADRQKRWREARKHNGAVTRDRGVSNAASNGAPDPTRPPPKGGEGRRRATPAARDDPADAQPRCPHHPTEATHACRMCRSERIGAA